TVTTGLRPGIDVGVSLKIAGPINELYVNGKYLLWDSPVLAVAAEGSLGAGFGPAKENNGDGTSSVGFSSNSVDLTAYGVGSLYFKDMLAVSGRLGFHGYTDGGPALNAFAEPDANGNPQRDQSKRDAGFRLMVALVGQYLWSEKLSYNLII